MSLFLTSDEICELTGRKLRSAQLRWLMDRGWIFETNAAGKPLVLRSYVDRRLGGAPKGTTGKGMDSAVPAPDFSAVR